MTDPVSDKKKAMPPAEDGLPEDTPESDILDKEESARNFPLTFILALIAIIGLLTFPWWQARWVAVVGPLTGIATPELYQTDAGQTDPDQAGKNQAEMAAMVARFSERLTQLEQQVEEASKKPPPLNEPVPSNIAEITTLTEQLAQLKQDVAGLANAPQPVPQPAPQPVPEISQSNPESINEGINQRINHLATMVAVTVQLTTLEQQQQKGQSLESSLDQLASSTEQHQNIQTAIMALRPYAKGGVTARRLSGNFARHIARIEADLATPAQASWWRQGLSNLQASVHLRKADEVENPVARAQRALALFTQSGPDTGEANISPDIAEAVSILSPYESQSQVLSDWLAQANQWLMAEAALDQLRQQIAAALLTDISDTRTDR